MSKKAKMTLQMFGPGILMASAAIGGSHLIASTQAGALYGWQLAIFIVLANFFKYPFFRFATDYTYQNNQSLVEGYASKGKGYLWLFAVMAFISGMINTAAVAMLCAVILGFLIPSLMLGTEWLAGITLFVSWLFLMVGHYKLLDGITRWIVIGLTVTTIFAVMMAMGRPSVVVPDFVPASPWNLATLGFIIALMGWMPAPIEISTITSLWTMAKRRVNPTLTYKQGLIDFNVGFWVSAGLALVFLALGVLVQYGTGEEIKMAGGQYVGQLILMYTRVIGDWAAPMVAFIAFMCMFGTTITVIDGYARVSAESIRLINGHAKFSLKLLNFWLSFFSVAGLLIVLYFGSQLALMLKFAMIMAFVSAPIFAWLNFVLVPNATKIMKVWAWSGLVFLSGFTILFLLHFFEIIG